MASAKTRTRGAARAHAGRAKSGRAAISSPHAGTTASVGIDHLHATIGNRAVGRLVNRDAATANRPAPATGTGPTPEPGPSGPAKDADQQLFPIFDRASNQKIMVDAVRYEEERVHLARLLRYLAKTIPEDAAEVLDGYPFEEVKDMYTDVTESLTTAGRYFSRGELVLARAHAKHASSFSDIEPKAHAILMNESALSYVGKRVGLAVIGFFEGAAGTVLGMVDAGAGLVGFHPGLADWNTKQYDKIKTGYTAASGIDHTLVHDDEIGRLGGKIATGLATGKALAGAGTAGQVVMGVQAVAGVKGTVDTITAMRKTGRSWGSIVTDPVALSQVAGAIAGVAGVGSGAGGDLKQMFDQIGLVATSAQLATLTTAIITIESDQSLSPEERYNKRNDLISDLVTTAVSTADAHYGKQFEAALGHGSGTEGHSADPTQTTKNPTETTTNPTDSVTKPPVAGHEGGGVPMPSPEVIVTEPTGEMYGPRQRKAVGPTSAAENGIPPQHASALQRAANVLKMIIKARPVNRDSSTYLERGTALAKMELIKAKTINDLDVYIGAPKDGKGLVGLFKPTEPPAMLEHKLYEAAMERYQERSEEYTKLKEFYKKYEAEGIVKIEDGMLKVADPRAKGDPHGEFKPVAGDIDIFDITHADGSALAPHERAAVQALLQSMGIGVEHGAHNWWEEQSPASYDKAMDMKIRGAHTEGEQLVAFVPGSGDPVGVWADTKMVAPEAGGNGGAVEVASPDGPAVGTADGGHPPGGEGGYIDLGELLKGSNLEGGLVRDEQAGGDNPGHALEQHVGLDQQDLQGRLDQDQQRVDQANAEKAERSAKTPGSKPPKLEKPMRSASTFTDIAVAHEAIVDTLWARRPEIEAWLASNDPSLPITSTWTGVTGITLERGASTPTEVTGIFLLLRKDTSVIGGYRIHTAYPVQR